MPANEFSWEKRKKKEKGKERKLLQMYYYHPESSVIFKKASTVFESGVRIAHKSNKSNVF